MQKLSQHLVSLMAIMAIVFGPLVQIARCLERPGPNRSPHRSTDPGPQTHSALPAEYNASFQMLWGNASPLNTLMVIETLPSGMDQVRLYADNPTGNGIPDGPSQLGMLAIYEQHDLGAGDASWSDDDIALASAYSYHVVAGMLKGGTGQSLPIIGFVLDQYVTVTGEDVEGDLKTLFVLKFPDSLADAIVDVKAQGELIKQSQEPPGDVITCKSDWIGNDGYQWCALSAALAQKRIACAAHFRSAIATCLIAFGAGFLACLGGCLLAFPPPTPHSLLWCSLICGLLNILGALLCVLEAYERYNACLAETDAWYYETLADHGCWPPPSEYAP